MSKFSKEQLKEAWTLGHFNDYLHELVLEEAVSNIQGNFVVDVDEMQPLIDAFLSGFYGHNLEETE